MEFPDTTFEERVENMKKFLRSLSEDDVAKFVCRLDDSVNSLGENNRLLAKAYADVLSVELQVKEQAK